MIQEFKTTKIRVMKDNAANKVSVTSQAWCEHASEQLASSSHFLPKTFTHTLKRLSPV